jgi:biotin-dependent carboxylase-like uncharacterized protein
MNKISILNPGPLTLIQDGGRYGYQKFGVPVSGVMDNFSYNISNILVDNKKDEAVLEFVMLGPRIKFDKDCIIAITGGESSPKLNESPISLWEPIKVETGDELSFGIMNKGCRGYIAFSGGIEVPEVMGSKSTYIKGSIGGIEGRALKTGDILQLGDVDLDKFSNIIKKLPKKYIPLYGNSYEIRVTSGPQEDHFTSSGIDDFFNEKFTITNQCDRMGMRLEGKSIEHIQGGDIISDGIVSGAIQIPGHGKPIIMMTDCQTTGGYAKIANVISSDLSKLAQARPGDQITFTKIDINAAHLILKEYAKTLEDIKNNTNSSKVKKILNYRINVNSKIYHVAVQEV